MVGSASWRNFMLSRSLLLCGGMNGQPLLDDSHDKQHSRSMLLGQKVEKFHDFSQRRLVVQEERDSLLGDLVPIQGRLLMKNLPASRLMTNLSLKC